MVEIAPNASIKQPLFKELGLAHVGTVVLLGQGPVQDAATKVKLADMYKTFGEYPGGEAEANTWLRMIVRAGAALWKTGQTDALIASGGARGNEFFAGGKTVPSEAQVMESLMTNLTKHSGNPELIKDEQARNTIWNLINAANIIDERGGDPNAVFVCAHFHKPRIKVLASLLGFDPNRVISAEEILTASARLAIPRARGSEFNPLKFDRQVSLLELINIRLGDDHAYFDRKKARALRRLDYKAGGRVVDIHTLFVEEQKSAADRMKDERRWVRGLAMEPEYVVPLLGQLKNEARRALALSHFPGAHKDDLDPAKWRWEVVKEEWKDQEYPQEVIDRLQTLGVSAEDRGRLSRAQVPELQFTGSSI